MQAAKDSFYMALRERLAALNPARTMVIDGVTVPAIVVRENLEPRFIEAQPQAFYLDFGDILIAESSRPMLGVDCHIWYASEGSGGTGVDRGRVLAEMDTELVRICDPPHTEMLDYSQNPARRFRFGDFLDGSGDGQCAGRCRDPETAVERWRWAGAALCPGADLFLSARGGSMTRAGLRPIARQTRAYFAASGQGEWADGNFRSVERRRISTRCAARAVDRPGLD